MKRLIYFVLFAVIALTSCVYEDTHEPFSDFNADRTLVVPTEVIFFTNYSIDAINYEWDFGDGNYSNLANPSHYYTQEGEYEVALAAYYGSRVDYSYLTIEVYYTSLEVKVVDWDTDKYVPRVKVDVYPSEYDYLHWLNITHDGVSDYNGSVIFIGGLNTQSYYIDVYNDYYNNFSFAKESINKIRTTPLKHAMHNVFTAYVDYAPNGLKITGNEIKVREVKITTEKRTLDNKALTQVKKRTK